MTRAPSRRGRGRAAGRTRGQPRAEGPRLGDGPSLISEDAARGCSQGWGAADGGPGPLDQRAAATHIGVPVPEDLVEKTPIDGLCGKTDEENLGFTYAELDVYIRTGVIEDNVKKESVTCMTLMECS